MDTKQFQQAFEAYNAERSKDDLDLVTMVRNLLLESGAGQQISNFDQNRFIIDAVNKGSDQQRFLLNRYFGMLLMASPKPSISERFNLIPNGSVDDWYKLFKATVLPFIIENNLLV